MPNNNTKYQQSIAAEFSAIKDRVRFFIEDRHWGEDGRYKEIILMNYLRRVLPNNIAVGTGFVKNHNNDLTSQIDIIIYKKNDPKLFSEGDFVVLMPESVLGIIEVKSKSTPQVLCRNNNSLSTIQKCHRNGEIIGKSEIFNGIFSYEKGMSFNGRVHSEQLVSQLKGNNGYLNHICFNDNIFMRYWISGRPNDDKPCFSFYDLSFHNIFSDQDTERSGLAHGYFISNLLETVYNIVAPHVLSEQYFEFLYPLENQKESFRKSGCEIIIDNDG